MVKEEREFEIDLLQLGRALLDKLVYIVIAMVIAGLLSFLGSTFLLKPVYQASAKMIVNTRNDDNQNVTNDQLNSAKNLVNTYAIIIRSRDVLDKVIDDLELDITYNELAASVSVNSVNNTQVMQILVRNDDPGVAYEIADKMLELIPDVIVQKVKAGSVEPVEQAYANPDPVSPNILKNTVIMAAFGFLVACVVVIIITMADNTYKTDLELQNDLDIPVLGVIPTVESCVGRHRYKYGYRDGYGYVRKPKGEK